MAATATPQKIASRLKVQQIAGAGSDAANVWPEEGASAWLDMQGYESILFQVRGAAVGNLSVEASAALTGTNPYVVRSYTPPAAAAAATDYINIEVTAEQIQNPASQAKDQLNRYVTVKASGATVSNIVAVRKKARFEEENLTADYVA